MPDLIASNVATRFFVARENPTSDSMATFIESQLAPLFKDFDFNVYSEKLVGEVSIAIDFFQAPKGSQGTVRWNAPKYVKISINGDGWETGKAPPAKVEAEAIRMRGIKKMRKTSGPPDKVMKSVITWFRNNQKDLTSGSDK